MLKKEKKRFKKFKQKEQRKEFFRELIHRLRAQEGRRLERWVIVYTRKCEKKGLRSPLEKMSEIDLGKKNHPNRSFGGFKTSKDK